MTLRRLPDLAAKLALVALLLICGPAAAQPKAAVSPSAVNPFADWTAVVAAGDFRAHSGVPAEVFDNARRDISKAFVGIGFAPENVVQFSVRPELYPDTKPLPVKPPANLYAALRDATEKTKGGCLIYMTSHGGQQGILYGDALLDPSTLDVILDRTCADRPTVVIISACFSGVFVTPLAGDNRMVMSAARPDRSSFGCSEEEVYTFFDSCILQSLPTSATFDVLAEKARTCVDRREKELKVGPPSEPQTAIGQGIKKLLPTLRLAARPPAPTPPPG